MLIGICLPSHNAQLPHIALSHTHIADDIGAFTDYAYAGQGACLLHVSDLFLFCLLKKGYFIALVGFLVDVVFILLRGLLLSHFSFGWWYEGWLFGLDEICVFRREWCSSWLEYSLTKNRALVPLHLLLDCAFWVNPLLHQKVTYAITKFTVLILSYGKIPFRL